MKSMTAMKATQKKDSKPVTKQDALVPGDVALQRILPNRAIAPQLQVLPPSSQEEGQTLQAADLTGPAGAVNDVEQVLERIVLEINDSHKLILSLCERVEKAITLSVALRQSIAEVGPQEAPSTPVWGETLRSTIFSIHTFASYAEKVCEQAQIALAITRMPEGNQDKEMAGDLLLDAKQALSQPPAETTNPNYQSIYTSTLEIWATLEMQKAASREIRIAVEELEKALS